MTIDARVVAEPRSQRELPGAKSAYRVLQLAAFAASWTGLYLGPLKVVDVLLLAAVVIGSIAILTDFIAPPRWMTFAAMAGVLVLGLNQVFPTDMNYLASRVSASDGFAGATASAIAQGESPAIAGLQWLIALVVVPIIFINITVKARSSVEPIMYAFAWGAGLSSLIAVTDFLGVTAIGQTLIEFTPEQYGRQNGLASHVNNLGFAAAISTPVALYLVRRGHGIAGTTLLMLLTAGTLLSGSRAAQAGAVVIVIGSLVLIKRLRVLIFPMVYALSLFAIGIYLFGGPYLDKLTAVLRFGSDAGAQQSDSGRFELARIATEDFLHSPLKGIGYGALTAAHSIYLQVLASGGLLLAVGMFVYWRGLVKAARSSARLGHPFAGVLLAMVAAWLLCGIFENMLVERYLYFVVGAVITMSLPHFHRGSPPDQAASSSANSAAAQSA